MVFSSMIFIFGFLPLVIAFYYITPRKYKNLVLLVFSIGFYSYGGLSFTVVVLGSITLNYIVGLLVEKNKGRGLTSKLYLALGIIINLSVLCYFKYFNFFVENFSSLLGGGFVLEKIIMPIGVSFFTFQGMSYVIDVYRGEKAQRSFVNIALYIMLFPHLIAGPIVRYKDIESQLMSRKESVQAFGYGVERFIYGLGKKVIISNIVGEVASDVFASSSPSVMLLWLGIICYTLQIYFDFSGYSDMAIGLFSMFGFRVLENFNYPYISKNISEFWRRWHISLGSFFRDYVYIPLGGNRCSPLRNLFNLFIVWGLTGFWHGAAWNFIVWGLYFGLIIACEKMFVLELLRKSPRWIQHVYTMLLVMIGWIIFNSPTLDYAIEYIKGMFFLTDAPIYMSVDMFYLSNYWIEILLGIVLSTPIIMNGIRGIEASKIKWVSTASVTVITPITLILIFYYAVMLLVNSSYNPFIYFRF
ncbi:MAG: MBOAT family O-acyltransferase [Clostridium sp.]